MGFDHSLFWFSSTRKEFLKKIPWINQFSVVEGWSRYQLRSALQPNAPVLWLPSSFDYQVLKSEIQTVTLANELTGKDILGTHFLKKSVKVNIFNIKRHQILFSITNLNMTCVWHTAGKIHHNWEQCNLIGWNFKIFNKSSQYGDIYSVILWFKGCSWPVQTQRKIMKPLWLICGSEVRTGPGKQHSPLLPGVSDSILSYKLLAWYLR